MINLLPPEVKTQLRYAQFNAKAMRVLWLAVFAVVLVAGALVGTYYYLALNIDQANTQLSQKTTVIDHFQSLQSEVATLNAKLSAIKSVQQAQPKFSAVLADIAAVTPKGVYINSITLTGDSTKPVLIAATATSYSQAVSFRDALVSSPRIGNADINAINSANGAITIQITVAFKTGEAK